MRTSESRNFASSRKTLSPRNLFTGLTLRHRLPPLLLRSLLLRPLFLHFLLLGGLTASCLLVSLAGANAAEPIDINQLFSQINGPEFEIEDLGPAPAAEEPNSTDFLTRLVGKSSSMDINMDVIQDGTNNVLLSTECSATHLKLLLERSATTVVHQEKVLRSFFERCKSEFDMAFPGSIPALLEFAFSKYQYWTNRFFRKVKITTADGFVLRGILGLKPSHEKLPIVIAKNGVFGDATDSPLTRYFLMQFFDQSPAHVLMLGNMSGFEHSRDNRALSIGGLHEGFELYQVADYLATTSHLRRYISEIYLASGSLGGLAAFYGNIYASQNRPADPQAPWIEGVLAICPVSNLQNSLNHVYFEGSIIPKVFEEMTWDVLEPLFDYIPVLSTYLPDRKKPNRKKMEKTVIQSALDHYRDLTTDWAAPFKGQRITNREELFGLNNFATYQQHAKIPTLVLDADDDMIILPTQNSKLVEKSRPADSALSIVHVNRANHCGFGTAFGWANMSAIFNGNFFGASKRAKTTSSVADLSLKDLGRRIPLRNDEVLLKYKFSIAKKANAFGLDTTIYMKYRSQKCRETNPLQPPIECLRREHTDIPLEQIRTAANISFIDSWLHSPPSTAEAQMLTRWANTHLDLLSEKRKPVQATQYQPYYLRVSVY